ncbi:hypothetical protein LWI29_033968 [Acer saccharum]|uniref:Cyclic nucleotide-binding domain-containing protein n=1 Tax=Acer saccharum TaxID=4024 RepID=A0AA39SVZ4_ACESA|nr:hypothetical protein LWI29_033968 [Acer saccharum]
MVAAQVCQSQLVGRSEDSLIGVPVHSSRVGAVPVSSEGPSSILDVSAGAVVSISSATSMVGQGSKVNRDSVSLFVGSFAQPIVSSVVSVDELDDRNLIKSTIDERTVEKRKKEHQAIKLRQQQLQQWVLFGKLSENLQNIIKECQQYSCQQTGVVDVENLFINLPKDVENNIKHELCLEPIKKVERFRRLSDTSLIHLCDCVKPVVYAERTRIVREGDPINEMFVLHGKLWNFSSAASSTNNVPPLDRRKEFLRDGDFWSQPASSLNQEGNTRRYCGEIAVKAVWSYVKKTLKGLTVNYWITFVSWIISVSLDPYICYVPSIDDEKKLLKMNSSLMITIWVLLYSLVLIPKMEIRAPVFSVLLAIFLAVYLMRIIGIYRLFTRSTSSGKLAEHPYTSIIKIAFNLLLYLYGGHLFGGLWYLFAVWKQLVCWRNVCLEQDHQICHYANNRFNVNPEGNKLLSDTCFAKIEDTYELGIFKDAFVSRIVEDTSDLGKKLFYCFRRGLQNISGFGTNLQVSNYTWESIFVVLITVYGVGTFTYFIGNMQNVINSVVDERRKKADQASKRVQQLQQWFTYGKLSENMQNCIKECQQTGGVDVRNNLKCKLGLELIRKVERFREWSDASLLYLCDCIKPRVYPELTCIVREGDPIDEMLFVLHGKLWSFSSAASSTNNVPPRDRREEFLKDGDFWAEELVNRVQDESSSSSLSKILISLHLKGKKKLISHTTIKALTKVEVFVLRIDDLKTLFNEKAKILQSWFRKRKKRQRWMELLTAIKSNREQTPPGDQLNGPKIDV